jgi:hypothetical protein
MSCHTSCCRSCTRFLKGRYTLTSKSTPTDDRLA